MQLERRRQVLASVDDVVRCELAKLCFGCDQDHLAQSFLFDKHADHQRLVVVQAAGRHRHMYLAGGRQLRPALHLHGGVRTVRQPVHDSIDAHIAQRQEHMQPAHRLPHQLRPHLELRHLPGGQRSTVVPARVGLQPAALSAETGL